MRILFFNYEFPPLGGGGANANAYLFREFSKDPALRIDCITSAWGKKDEVVDYSKNITLYRLAVGKRDIHFWTQKEVLTYLWRAHRKAEELLGENHYDICHAFFGFPSGMLAWLGRSRLPYLVSLRGSDVPGFNPRFSWQYVVLKPLFRRIWREARFVVANSHGLRALAHEFEPAVDIPVIPNGIDTIEFTPSAEREPGHILCVSRLVARKGVQHLIEALPEVLLAMPQAQLTVVGEGDLEKDLKKRAEELKIKENVHFLGYVPHEKLPAVYQRFQLYVQPSFYEGMSNTVLEAMACGLPIVATGEGGREELFHGNAAPVPFGDSAALARTLVDFLKNSAKLENMGKRSRDIALEFSWAAVAQQYKELYRLTGKS